MTIERCSVIFDLDGTLVDSSPGIISSLNAAFEATGIKPIREPSPSMIGPPLRETLLHLSPSPENAIIDQLSATFKAHYDSIGFQGTRPFLGANEMLLGLRDANITLYVATNKRQVPTSLILDALHWSSLFAQSCSPDSFSPPARDKAEILTKLIAVQNHSPLKYLYVGDRIDDFYAAKQVGIPFALADWGFDGDDAALSSDAIRLRSPDAGFILNQFTEQFQS